MSRWKILIFVLYNVHLLTVKRRWWKKCFVLYAWLICNDVFTVGRVYNLLFLFIDCRERGCINFVWYTHWLYGGCINVFVLYTYWIGRVYFLPAYFIIFLTMKDIRISSVGYQCYMYQCYMYFVLNKHEILNKPSISIFSLFRRLNTIHILYPVNKVLP